MSKEVKVHFFLRDKKAKNKTSILCLFSVGSDRIKLSTGLSIKPEYWDPKKENSKDDKAVNDSLKSISDSIIEYNYSIRAGKKEIDFKDFKPLIEVATGIKATPIKQKENPRAFYLTIDHYIDNNKNLIAYNTLKKYFTLRRFLEDGYKINGIAYPPYAKGITIDEINSEWAIKLKSYCLEKMELNNTINKRFQLIRTILKYAKRIKVIKEVDFESFSHPQDDKIESIALNDEDIEKLKIVKCTEAESNIRDLFLLLLYTGADFADYKKLNKKNLKISPKGIRYFEFVRRKTKKKEIYSYPECTQECFDLLESRNWKFKEISYDKSLAHIKEVARKAGLIEPIEITKRSGDREIVETKPKWEWIAFKTPRRTSITNDLQVNKESIEFTAYKHGHTKISTTQKYQHPDPGKMVDNYKRKIE